MKTKVLLLLFCLLASVSHAGELEDKLLKAAIFGSVSEVNGLFELGVDVNARNKDGQTALMLASFVGGSGSIPLVNAFIEKGMEVNAKDNYGQTALMLASSRGCLDVVKALLEKGADVNAKANTGVTALILAKKKGHWDVVNLLLEKSSASDPKDPGRSEPRPSSLSKRIMSDIEKCVNEYVSVFVGQPLISLPTCSCVIERFDNTPFHRLGYKLSLISDGGFTIGGNGQYVVNKDAKVEVVFNGGALTVTGPANGKGGFSSIETLKVSDGVRIRTTYGNKDYKYSNATQTWTETQ